MRLHRGGFRGTLVFLALATGACTTWRRDPNALTVPIPSRRPLQIWSGNTSLVAHGVEVRGDSVRAVPRWRPPECDSCARFFALPAIDSVRIHAISPARTTALGMLLLAWVYVAMGIAGYGGPGS